MELSPVLIVFIIVMLLSGLRAVFEFLGRLAVEAERAARRAQEENRQRQAQRRAGMPEAQARPPSQRAPVQPPESAPGLAYEKRPPSGRAPVSAARPPSGRAPAQVQAPRPAPQPQAQPVLLEEILRQMMGEPPRQAPPAPKPAPKPKPKPQPVAVAADSGRRRLDLDHQRGERQSRITSRLTDDVADRKLASALRPDDQIAIRRGGKTRRDVLTEIDRRLSPMQKAVIYAELLGKPRAHTGPMWRAPTRRV